MPGTGPWVQADLEYGLYSGGSPPGTPTRWRSRNNYVTAMLKNNGTTQFALKGGNAQSGSLTTLWNGSLPGGYSPMKQQGAIILGSGGDCCSTNSNQSLGTFYEGAIVAGYPVGRDRQRRAGQHRGRGIRHGWRRRYDDRWG